MLLAEFINSNNIEYVTGGGVFLLVGAFAIKIVLRLQRGAELTYERRADRQTATIADLDRLNSELRADNDTLRQDMYACHEQRELLQIELKALKLRVMTLEKEVRGIEKASGLDGFDDLDKP